MLRRFRTYFFTGLIVVVPIGVTIWIVFSMFNFMDTWFNDLVLQSKFWTEHLAEYVQVPHYGVGFVLTIILICLVGFFASLYIGRKILDLVDSIFLRIPGISTIYNALKQISESVAGRKNKLFEKVVLIEYPRRGIYSLGFITSYDDHVFSPLVGEDLVYVFLPTTPNPTSGFFLLIPERDAVELNLSVEDAMKLIISGGMVAPKKVVPLPDQLERSSIGKSKHPVDVLE
ncbi:MAG: DUF502 domain-containing protein [bacterium]|nr:DUF502 domain-containing protein [bacterium]